MCGRVGLPHSLQIKNAIAGTVYFALLRLVLVLDSFFFGSAIT